MHHHPQQKRNLVTVRTYPTPARKGVEVSCTRGITHQQEWIRLFPVPYRRMNANQQFKKYQWIDVEVTKASDSRPESYTPNLDSIKIVGSVGPEQNWAARKELIYPLLSHCLCCLEKERKRHLFPTLGIFKPKTIRRFLIEPDEPRWTSDQLARLRQQSLFDASPARELEKIPFKFKYEFECDEVSCGGHELSCTDWEINESYRKWKRLYGANWKSKLRQKYETEMILRNDTHFYVGTLHAYPSTWIIVGLFYPRADN